MFLSTLVTLPEPGAILASVSANASGVFNDLSPVIWVVGAIVLGIFTVNFLLGKIKGALGRGRRRR